MHNKEQIVAKLQALKAAPGMQMHWQEQIDSIIADMSAPALPPPPPPKPAVEAEMLKSKVTTAAHVTPAKTKGHK